MVQFLHNDFAIFNKLLSDLNHIQVLYDISGCPVLGGVQ